MDFSQKLKKESTREVKVEKYNTSVITVYRKPEKGLANKISLNKAAAKALDLVEGGIIGFIFTEDKFLCKGGEGAYTVSKTNNSINDKPLSEAIRAKLGKEDGEDIEFDLVEMGQDVFSLVLKVEEVEPIVEEEAVEAGYDTVEVTEEPEAADTDAIGDFY